MTIIIPKPRTAAEINAVINTAIICGASGCDVAATEMFHHSLCGGGNPSCTHHADEGREWLRLVLDAGDLAMHHDCDDLITPVNHSFRPI